MTVKALVAGAAFTALLAMGTAASAAPVPVLTIPATFTDLNPKTIGGVTELTNVTFQMTNSTGKTWTDFHVTANAGSFQNNYSGPGSETVSNTGSGVNATGTLDILSLSVPDGNVLTFSITAFPDSFSPVVGFTANPTVVPVPAALPLLGTAMAGLGLIGWRRNKKTA